MWKFRLIPISLLCRVLFVILQLFLWGSEYVSPDGFSLLKLRVYAFYDSIWKNLLAISECQLIDPTRPAATLWTTITYFVDPTFFEFDLHIDEEIKA